MYFTVKWNSTTITHLPSLRKIYNIYYIAETEDAYYLLKREHSQNSARTWLEDIDGDLA